MAMRLTALERVVIVPKSKLLTSSSTAERALSVFRAGYFVFLACVMESAIFAPTSARSADQAQKVARVALVDPYSASASTNRETSEFWMRLQELGWIRGQNLAAETRWADGQVDRLPALMANLVA